MILHLQCNACKSSVPTELEFYNTYRFDEFTTMPDGAEYPCYTVWHRVYWIVYECSKCKTPLIGVGVQCEETGDADGNDVIFLQQVFPKPVKAHELPQTAPPHIIQDFKEASACLDCSPRAAAALCRKALHGILIDKCNGSGANFAEDIRRAKDDKHVFGRVYELIAAVQKCGNYSVHAKWNKDTLEMIETSREEAELLLDVTKDVMVHFYETVPRENQLLKRIRENSRNGLDTPSSS